MTSQAKEFPLFFNRISSPRHAMIAVNSMTDSRDISNDGLLPEYRVVAVKRNPKLDVMAMSRILFVKLMTGIVMCGRPIDLRVEWQSPPYYDEYHDCLACSLAVVGYPTFLSHWDEKISEACDIRDYLAGTDVTDQGLRALEVPGDPPEHFHEFVTPLPLSTVRALFISVMLALYDAGPLEELEIAWREEPSAKQEKIRMKDLWVAKAKTIIGKKSRIVVAT